MPKIANVHYKKETDWADAGLIPADFAELGSVTNIQIQSRRDGPNLLYRGTFLVGTTTGGEARVNLKLAGNILTSSSIVITSSVQVSGTYTRNTTISSGNGGDRNILIEPNKSYLTFGLENPAQAGLAKLAGSTLNSTSLSAISIEASIPISGWEINQ